MYSFYCLNNFNNNVFTIVTTVLYFVGQANIFTLLNKLPEVTFVYTKGNTDVAVSPASIQTLINRIEQHLLHQKPTLPIICDAMSQELCEINPF